MLPYSKFFLQQARIFLLLPALCFTVIVNAQNNTSPYSIIGIGDIEKSSFDRSSGMGSAGLALSSNRFMYQANPASYSSLPENFFHMELATRYKSVSYSGKPITDVSQMQSSDIQFKKIALAVKIRPGWAVSIGVLPFSTTNYSFYSTKSVQGTNFSSLAYYQGSGSTNQFYVANSFNVTKHLSVGLQASYLFGQLQETENFSQDVTDSVLTTNRNIFIGSPFLKLGLQYKAKLNKHWDLAFGATVSNKTKINADYHLLVQDGSTVLIDKEYTRNSYFTIPVIYAGGLAAVLQNTYTFAVDYNYQPWSALNQKGISYSLVNSSKLAGGVEYAPKLTLPNGQVFEKYFLQAGFFYSNSYLKIYGQQLNDYGISFGAGTQLRQSGLGVQLGLEIGKRGTTDYGLIKEKYTQVNFTLSYRDFWLPKKFKRYD